MARENGSPTLDAKSKKYDRQLRLWGAHGQMLLESAKICLLRCGPTGSETLKNLVLGGIAAFTVVDDAKVVLSLSVWDIALTACTRSLCAVRPGKS